MQVAQVVVNKFYGVLAKVVLDCLHQAAAFVDVGVQNLVRVPHRHGKPAVGRRVRKAPHHHPVNLLQQHRRCRAVPPLLQKAASLNGPVVHCSRVLVFQCIRVGRNGEIIIHLRLLISVHLDGYAIDHAFGIYVQNLSAIIDPVFEILVFAQNLLQFSDGFRWVFHLCQPFQAKRPLHLSGGIVFHIGYHHTAFCNVVHVLHVLQVLIQRGRLRQVDFRHFPGVHVPQPKVVQRRVHARKFAQFLPVFFPFQHVAQHLHAFLYDRVLLCLAVRQRLAKSFQRAAFMLVAPQHLKHALRIIHIGVPRFFQLRQLAAIVFQLKWVFFHLPLCLCPNFACSLLGLHGQQFVLVACQRDQCARNIPQFHHFVQRQASHPVHLLAAPPGRFLVFFVQAFKLRVRVVPLRLALFQPSGVSFCARLHPRLPLPYVTQQAVHHVKDAAVFPVCGNAAYAVVSFGFPVQLRQQTIRLCQVVRAPGHAVQHLDHPHGVRQQFF